MCVYHRTIILSFLLVFLEDRHFSVRLIQIALVFRFKVYVVNHEIIVLFVEFGLS